MEVGRSFFVRDKLGPMPSLNDACLPTPLGPMPRTW